jgi:hypothetical protein
LKIVVFRYDAKIVTLLSNRYDNYRRPEGVSPLRIVDKEFKKNSLPAIPEEA